MKAGLVCSEVGVGVPSAIIAAGVLLLVFGKWFIEYLRHINEKGNVLRRMYARLLRDWQGFLIGILFIGIGLSEYSIWVRCVGWEGLMVGGRVTHVLGWCLILAAEVVAIVGCVRVSRKERRVAANLPVQAEAREGDAAASEGNAAAGSSAGISWRPRGKAVGLAGAVAVAGIICLLVSAA